MEEEEFSFTEEFWQGDLTTFENFVKAYEKKMFNICYSILLHQQDAEDAAQETFLRIYNSLKKFKGKSAPFTWIYRIATNCAFDVLRRKRSRLKTLSPEENPDFPSREHPGADKPDLEKLLRKQDIGLLVRNILLKLPVKYRQAITLVYLQELPLKDAAELIGCPVNTLKPRLCRGLKMIRKIIKENHDYQKQLESL